MGDDDRVGQRLPHRARGPAEGGSAQAAAPSLSAEMRQRMQAAVESERARATGQDQKPAGPPPKAIAPGPARQGGLVPSTSQNQPFPPIQPAPLVTPEPAAYPLPAAVAPVTGRPAVPQPEPKRRGTLTGAIATALILIAAGSLGVAVARYVTAWTNGAASATSNLTPAEKYTEQQAATWVSGQVSHTAVVACDPAMCQALTADHFPAREELVLGPTTPPPVTSAVVIVTLAVRNLFGSSLTPDYAPAILATFGSADATVTVQVIDAQGTAAYHKDLEADLSKREQAGAILAKETAITASTKVKQQLLAGAPDSRLLLAITALVPSESIDILDFGNIGPATDSTIPLRYVDLAESDPDAHLTGPAYVRALRADLGAMPSLFRPTRVVPMTVDGQAALRVEFTAPSQLGTFDTP